MLESDAAAHERLRQFETAALELVRAADTVLHEHAQFDDLSLGPREAADAVRALADA